MSARSSSSSSYSHLLYLNDADRQMYLTQSPSPQLRRESTSYFSMTSTRCSSESDRSTVSADFTLSTSRTSVQSTVETPKISTPKYADDHYPLISSLALSSPLSRVSQAFETHSAVQCAREMACIHNTIIRGLNSAFNHALVVKPSTTRCEDFLHFSRVLCSMLEHHHEVEEKFLFPAFERLLNQPGAMDDNINAHHSILEGFQDFKQYISNSDTVAHFDGLHFRKLVESFAPELIQHLHDEIPSILTMCEVDSKELRKIWMQAQKLTAQVSDLYVDSPFILGCQDKSFLIDGEAGEFPSTPWVLETLVRKWYSRRHAGVWEFCPSDLQGNRKMLHF